MKMLKVDSVILSFGDKDILKDVYLNCEFGKITSILGRNGFGKTSLMKIIYGEIIPQQHFVSIDGNVQLGKKREYRDITYLPQKQFIPKRFKLSKVFEDFNIDWDEFCSLFEGFDKHKNQRVGKLSGGESRVIEVYLIIKSKSKYSLLDEPFSNIMLKHIDTIKDLIKEESKNKGFLITDHLHTHITDLSNTIYITTDKRVFEIKEKSDLIKYGYLPEGCI